MKRLLLVRHAKSSWDYLHLSDHDRPLNSRGERDAPLMAQRLADRGESLDVIISSTAVRAMAIAEAISRRLSLPLTEESELYTFSAHQLYQQLLDLPDNYNHIAVVGHNPAITDVVNRLLNGLTDNVPTSGIVAMDCDVDHWHKLSPEHCRISYFDTPKHTGTIA